MTAPSTPVKRPRRWVRRLRNNRAAMAALVFLFLLLVTAVFRGLLAPHDPYELDLSRANEGPGADYWLGTDTKGRDILSRLVFASRVAVVAATEAVALALVAGAGLGLIAGYVGRIFDAVVSRVFDSLMALPGLVLALAVVGVLGPGLTNAMIAIGILLAPSFYRIARSGAQAARHETYIDAARVMGCGSWRILFRHVLPNAASPLVVQASFSVGLAVLAESGLSFLGLGAQPPEPSWGSMLDEAFSNFYRSTWHIVPPIVMIVGTILACSLLGDALRDATGREVPRG